MWQNWMKNNFWWKKNCGSTGINATETMWLNKYRNGNKLLTKTHESFWMGKNYVLARKRMQKKDESTEKNTHTHPQRKED